MLSNSKSDTIPGSARADALSICRPQLLACLRNLDMRKSKVGFLCDEKASIIKKDGSHKMLLCALDSQQTRAAKFTILD